MLFLGDQRPEIDRRVEAMPNLQLAGLFGDALDDLVVDRLMGEQPRARRAALALIVEDRARGSGDGELEIGVGEDDGRRFAAKLQRDALEIAGRRLDDQLADFGRAGERHLVDVRMFGERRPGRFAIAGDDVHHAVGEAGLGDEFAEPDRRQRGLFGGLQHDSASRRQRGR